MTLDFDAATAPVKAAWYDEESMLSEKMSQALKHQKLMSQERLRKCAPELDSACEKADKWRAKCEELSQTMLTEDRTLQHILGQNSSLLTEEEVHSKDREIESSKKDVFMQEALKERDELSEYLKNLEIAFEDFDRRYEKAKHVIRIMKERMRQF